MGICWYAIDKSSTENTVPPECLAYKSSIRGNGYETGLHTLVTVTLKSPQFFLKTLLVFCMGTMVAAQLLCEIGKIMFCLTIFDSSF